MNDSLKNAFEEALKTNYWGDTDSVSGPGSNMIQTRIIRDEIPRLLAKYKIKQMLDAPCGDLFWMRHLLPGLAASNISYTGADIVPAVLERNAAEFKQPNTTFLNVDLTTDPVPPVELVLTRDCFIHLSYSNIFSILKNYRKAGIKYLLVSTYTDPSRKNYDVDGFFIHGRMLNMQKFPFSFPLPSELIVEGCTEGNGEFADKSLGLWEINQLNFPAIRRSLFLSNLRHLFDKALQKGDAIRRRLFEI